MEKDRFVMVDEVDREFKVSRGFDYKLIKQMNDELKA